MRSNPLTTEKYKDVDSENNKKFRICQCCLDVATLKKHDTGAPTIINGHLTSSCDRLDEFVHKFESGAFGMVIPKAEVNTIWEFQTDGLMCSHPSIRGTYIPLRKPIKPQKNIDESRVEYQKTEDNYYANLLYVLASTNYANNTGANYDTEYIWSLIDDELPFNYNIAKPPFGYRDTHEGWKWIEITESVPDPDFISLDPLVGERVLLVYPNSD